ncbi:hypothetical protein J2S30_005263 [Herbaspirillum rubrisubalbicans]|uniref:hypothetical protein n=1 Tax=Herbaspirillum rubrisubalbicans TaxID=80842 RepID=UPI00209FCD2D|nr:hypothetical protein [Herbaspirillum rubrisubalbicans]MCP1576884.1 hypothetical protein [Herbaspirillum rubrisubalbicans]
MNAQAGKRSNLEAYKRSAGVELTSTIEKKVEVPLREASAAIDIERDELDKKAIDDIKPDKTFDTRIVREINKLEIKKNRLIVTRVAALLKKDSDAVQAIAD